MILAQCPGVNKLAPSPRHARHDAALHSMASKTCRESTDRQPVSPANDNSQAAPRRRRRKAARHFSDNAAGSTDQPHNSGTADRGEPHMSPPENFLPSPELHFVHAPLQCAAPPNVPPFALPAPGLPDLPESKTHKAAASNLSATNPMISYKNSATSVVLRQRCRQALPARQSPDN